MNRFELLDAAWRRWQSGEVTERGPFPKFGDAYRLENGIGLGEKITPPGHVAFCSHCGRSLSQVEWHWLEHREWIPIGPECRKIPPLDRIRRARPGPYRRQPPSMPEHQVLSAAERPSATERVDA